jgi:hypothetical protein
MTTPVRFAYTGTSASHAGSSLLAHLPITLRHGSHAVTVQGLLDTGSTVNVLPYTTLVFSWAWCGNSSRLECT